MSLSRIHSRLTLTQSTQFAYKWHRIRVVCISNNFSYFVICLHWCEWNPNTILLLQPVHRCRNITRAFLFVWNVKHVKIQIPFEIERGNPMPIIMTFENCEHNIIFGVAKKHHFCRSVAISVSCLVFCSFTLVMLTQRTFMIMMMIEWL